MSNALLLARRALQLSAVRTVCAAPGRRAVGRFPSRAFGKSLPWESRLERDYLHLCEVDSEIIDVDAQPVRIEFHGRGAAHAWSPDFRVVRADTVTLVEVKGYARRHPVLREIDLARAAAQLGCAFHLVTPESLAGARLANAKTLLRAGDRRLTREQLLWVRTAGIRARLCLQHLVRTSAPRIELADLYALHLQRVVSIDLDLPLSPTSAVVLWESNR